MDIDKILKGLDSMTYCFRGGIQDTAEAAKRLIRAQAERIGYLEEGERRLVNDRRVALEQLKAAEESLALVREEKAELQRRLDAAGAGNVNLIVKPADLNRRVEELQAPRQDAWIRAADRLMGTGAAGQFAAQGCTQEPAGVQPSIEQRLVTLEALVAVHRVQLERLSDWLDSDAADHHNADPGSQLTRWLRNRKG